MTLTIFDTRILSDQTGHTAWLTASPTPGWQVTWLPGRRLDRNTAITAMTLADTASEGRIQPGHRLWPALQSWSEELGLSATDALTRISQPPPGFARKPEGLAQHQDREAAE
jgi:hypothetical protein